MNTDFFYTSAMLLHYEALAINPPNLILLNKHLYH
jgi:hypothetical protein